MAALANLGIVGAAAATALACGGSRAHVEPLVQPSITVSDAGVEPRRIVRYELTAHAPEEVEVDLKLSVSSVAGPTVKLVGRVEASAVTATGDAAIDYEVEEVTVLDDVVDPAIRKQAEDDARRMKGMRSTWHMTPSGRISEMARFTASPASAAAAVKHVADSVQDTAVVVFPSEPIGVGASWNMAYGVRSSGVRWDRTVMYRLKALTDSTATVDVEVSMHAPSQTVSVEPTATTTLTSGTVIAAGEVVVALRGLVGTGIAKGNAEVDFETVRRHGRFASTLRAETTVSVKSGASAAAPLVDANAANMPLVASTSSVGTAITGFYATGSGELTGHAVDAAGKPLGGVEVHVVSKTGGERIVTTDKAGNYTVVLEGAPTETSMIFVRDHPGAHIGGTVAESVTVDGLEGIDIHETLPPKVVAKPVTSELVIPDYSDAAKAADVWARAWLMLDIDQAGVVRHVKMIKRPGYGLDEIAVRDAFKLRFEPARNRADQPVSSILLWTYEWPAYSWLSKHHKNITTIPDDVSKVTCQIDGMPGVGFRDCAQPDVRGALDEAWISPKR